MFLFCLQPLNETVERKMGKESIDSKLFVSLEQYGKRVETNPILCICWAARDAHSNMHAKCSKQREILNHILLYHSCFIFIICNQQCVLSLFGVCWRCATHTHTHNVPNRTRWGWQQESVLVACTMYIVHADTVARIINKTNIQINEISNKNDLWMWARVFFFFCFCFRSEFSMVILYLGLGHGESILYDVSTKVETRLVFCSSQYWQFDVVKPIQQCVIYFEQRYVQSIAFIYEHCPRRSHCFEHCVWVGKWIRNVEMDVHGGPRTDGDNS